MQLSSLRKKSLVNLTPLIDVVFILLIFFMLASNFTRWHTLELSVSKMSEIEIDQHSLSIVSISHDATYMLNDELMSLNGIISKLDIKVKNNYNHPIVIKPEKGANIQAMINILNPLQELAANNISIAKPILEN